MALLTFSNGQKTTAGGAIAGIYERNTEATIYVGNLDAKVDDEILWELFVQCGPVAHVSLPKDRLTGTHQGYGFVEFRVEDDADYACKIMNMVKLFDRPIRCNRSSSDRKTFDIGANLFVSNLDLGVDDKLLQDTFGTFGNVLYAKVMQDPESGESKGFGFVSYDNFEASDGALSTMNGQFLCNKPIHVSYAYKRDTKGERHGSAAERLLAANRNRPLYDSGAPSFGGHPGGGMMSVPAPPSAPMPLAGVPPPPMGGMGRMPGMPMPPNYMPPQGFPQGGKGMGMGMPQGYRVPPHPPAGGVPHQPPSY